MAELETRNGDARVALLVGQEEAMTYRIAAMDNEMESRLNEVTVFDMADADKTLTKGETLTSAWEFTDVSTPLTANRVVSFDTLYKKSWWAKDSTADAYTLTLQPSGGSGIVLPKGQWVQVWYYFTAMPQPIGWKIKDATLHTYEANWGNTSGRNLRVYKEDGQDGTRAGGVVKLEGAVEKSTAIAINDIITTLDAGYRPAVAQSFLAPVDPDSTTLNEDAYGVSWVQMGVHANNVIGAPGDYIDYRGDGKVLPDANRNWDLPHKGSIVGLSGSLNCFAQTTAGDVYAQVYISGAATTLVLTFSIDGTGRYTAYTSQALDVDTFSAGDYLTAEIRGDDFVGTTNIHYLNIELVFENEHQRYTQIDINTSGQVKIRGPVPYTTGQTIDLTGIEFPVGN